MPRGCNPWAWKKQCCDVLRSFFGRGFALLSHPSLRYSDWTARQWRHCVLSTYGAWLHGDPRGFRTRHHREHVEGDYRNPPPAGKYADKLNRSRKALKQSPIVLAPRWRKLVSASLVQRLSKLDAYVACAAVGGQHIHLLLKIPKGSSQVLLGKAKRHAWFVAREAGWTGRLWAKRGSAKPVRDRRHQARVYQYILGHAKQGAWIWVSPEIRR
jgi:hypothetical protein